MLYVNYIYAKNFLSQQWHDSPKWQLLLQKNPQKTNKNTKTARQSVSIFCFKLAHDTAALLKVYSTIPDARTSTKKCFLPHYTKEVSMQLLFQYTINARLLICCKNNSLLLPQSIWCYSLFLTQTFCSLALSM